MEAPMVQTARVNGHSKKKTRRMFTSRDWKKWVRWADKIGPQATAEKFGIVPSMVHTARVRLEALPGKSHTAKSKARRADSRAKPGGSKGSKRAAPRASYKARRASPRGGAIGDAVVYLTQAIDRAASLGREAYPVLGLLSLALEALGAPLS